MSKAEYSNIKVLYLLATINGMAAFRLSFRHPIIADLSYPRTIYCYAFSTLILVLIAIITKARIVEIILHRDDKFVGNLIFLVQLTVSALATAILCFFQVVRRHDYVRLINKCLVLHQMIAAQNSKNKPPSSSFFDCYCLGLYKMHIAVTVFQVALMLSPLLANDLNGDNSNLKVPFVFVLYTHILRTFFGLIFFGSMLVVLQLFRDVNGRIGSIMDDMDSVQTSVNRVHGRMQRYCDLSDGLDVMAKLYERATELVADLVHFFGVQVLVALINAFMNILFGV